ncbi:hypothetical protein [Companilactobacillus nodensis]|uniref:Integral membrane protein n=1 Tax=Companilactobacillus nodensis DSM 19682 = JCM 14932 = NBRC 107160 TaxID=1423775 RepID=A0A0R1KHY8_9LACO|nr:hypothetical protein [Companilactobacillus nodensis]KRK81139.1 hypothetical protein FD03_GL000731 [Companilactobacillus nodensis DSM 19682 = JCM 14932 = NBRC 107160]
MDRNSKVFQRIAWIIFSIELILIVGIGLVSHFYPKDPTAAVDNFLKFIMSFYFIIFAIIIEVLTYFAIKNMTKENQSWNIVLIVMGFISNPLYLIPSIGELILHLKNKDNYGHI